MSINIQELAQYQNYWSAYGKQYASRWIWNKKTNAELASTMDTQATIEKLRAHDNRARAIRWFIRRFTSIEKRRELLAYTLITKSLNNLNEPNHRNTLRINQPLLEILSAIAMPSPRAWLKKSIGAFTNWIEKYSQQPNTNRHQETAPQDNHEPNNVSPQQRQHEERSLVLTRHQPNPANILASRIFLPAGLNTKSAFAQFHLKLQENLNTIIKSFKECSVEAASAMGQHDKERYQSSFNAFRKIVRKIQLHYHPDKISAERAKNAGFTLTIYKELMHTAFINLTALIDKINREKSDLIEIIETNFSQNDQLKELKEGFDEVIESYKEIRKDINEMKIAVSQLVKEFEEHNKRIDEVIESRKELEKNANALFEKQNAFINTSTQELAEMRAKIQALSSIILANQQNIDNPQAARPSINSAALFTQDNAHRREESPTTIQHIASTTPTSM